MPTEQEMTRGYKNMILKGFKFGMLLQLAVGPVCLMVFKISGGAGLAAGFAVAFAAALVDGGYILLAGLGASALLHIGGVRRFVKFFGFLVLAAFGLDTLLSAFGFSFLPHFRQLLSGSAFLQGLVLTASNPLTILFWSGIFSTQVTENHLDKRQLAQFGAGCVFSTIVFLSSVAVAGSLFGAFLPPVVQRGLNIIIGAALIGMGARLLIKKDKMIADT
jgi:threonine/homoserine/homoserine lactone efflux protein